MVKITMGNNLVHFLLFLLSLTVVGCKQTEENTATTTTSQAIKKCVSKKGIAASKQLLHDGDIVLRTGSDVISGLFAQLNKRDKTYSHCGITFLEHGQWVVYHSIGGEDNPDEKLRRDAFDKFVSSEHNLGYAICRYPLNSKQTESLKNTVLSFYTKQIPFDMKFDLHTDDRLYCAEMIYKAFNIALDTSHFFKTTTHKGFEYVSTDNIFGNNNARILCHIVY
jgi:Permuted papain-like amidase enzyme, YaeF/YiiX, C92 family